MQVGGDCGPHNHNFTLKDGVVFCTACGCGQGGGDCGPHNHNFTLKDGVVFCTACACGSLVQRNPAKDPDSLILPGVRLDNPSRDVQAGVTTNNSSNFVQAGVTTDNQSELPSDDLHGVYEPYANGSLEAQYMAEWLMLTKPEKEVSTSEWNTLRNLYSQRTHAALITSSGAYSDEKMKYRCWLNWVIRPKGVIDKKYTRLDHKHMNTDQTFLSAIVRRNGPDWIRAAETVLCSRLRNPGRGEKSRSGHRKRRIKKHKKYQSDTDAVDSKLVDVSKKVVTTVLRQLSNDGLVDITQEQVTSVPSGVSKGHGKTSLSSIISANMMTPTPVKRQTLKPVKSKKTKKKVNPKPKRQHSKDKPLEDNRSRKRKVPTDDIIPEPLQSLYSDDDNDTKRPSQLTRPGSVIAKPHVGASVGDLVAFGDHYIGTLITVPGKGKWKVQWMGNEQEDPWGGHLPCWTWRHHDGFYVGKKQSSEDIPYTCKINRTDIRACGFQLDVGNGYAIPEDVIKTCFPDMWAEHHS